MNLPKMAAPLALLTASVLTLSACAVNEQGGAPATGPSGSTTLSGTLSGKGATSMKVAQETWIAGFQTANPDVTVNYSPDGSGAGREAFIEGAVAFAGSDRALKDDEMGAGKFGACTPESNALNLPVYISPIALIFNVPGVEELKLDATTVAGIFSGRITRWNDAAIAATNPDASLPDAAITAVHRADDSGTTENFTDYLHQAAPDVWTPEADGMWPEGFGGEAAQGTSGVVSAVRNGQNTIGYADESQAGDLAIATVKVGEQFIGPTPEDAAKIVDNSEVAPGRGEHDYALELNRNAEGAYPIALVSYAIACEAYADPANAALVKAYLGYVVSGDGQVAAQKTAGSAPLSAEMAARMQAAVDSIK